MATEIKPHEKYPSTELIECPYPHFDRMRKEAPIVEDPDSGVFILYRHEDILFVLQHPELFPHTGTDAYGEGGISSGGVPMISACAPPEHTEMRWLASRPLRPVRLKSYEPMIAEFSEKLIDTFVDRGEVELANEFAIPIPALVTCRLMGFPESGPDFDFIVDRMSMRSSDQPGVSDQGFGTERLGGRSRGLAGIHEYMREALENRRKNPGDDLLSELIQLQVHRDGEFRLDYLDTICTELLSGGVVTTAQMMVNAMLLLLENPEQMTRVRADESRLPLMFEESLRVESPVQSLTRICVQDCEVGGVKIPAGGKVLMVFGSANRDPERFPDPERFDIDRRRDQLKVHFGFGYGLHFCVGAPLARLEGRLAFEHFLARTKNIRLAPGKNDFKHIASTHFRALRSLHLEFDPA
jgi:cytochrome P450